MRACTRRYRAVAGVVTMLAGVVLASCGGSDGSRTGNPGGGLDAAPPSTTAAPKKVIGAPRWETVTTLKGSGASKEPAFEIMADAIQWRARWRCETGALRVTTDPPPRRPAPLVDSGCPQKGEGFSLVTGKVRLAVEASAPWELVIDQQVETPLEEPPPPGTDKATVLSEGAFYRVEMNGKGTARLYLMPDGSRVLRFDGFEVSANTDLFVWLSESASPRTSIEASRARFRSLGNVKSTLGAMNYSVPADLPTDQIRSVVIWCEPVAIAYAAASLERR